MKILWLEDVALNVVDSIDDDEVIDDHELKIKRGEIYRVDIVNEDETHVDIQFCNDLVAFGVLKNYYREVFAEGGTTEGDRSELCCPLCGAPQNELDGEDEYGLQYDCSTCRITFKIEVESTYKVTDIREIA